MSKTFALTYGMLADGTPLSGSSSVTDGATAIIDEALAIGTNTVRNIAIPVANLKSLFMKFSVATTLKTNDSGAPDDTLVFAAGGTIVWDVNSAFECPLTVDVEQIYTTNVAVGTIQIYALYDPTP